MRAESQQGEIAKLQQQLAEAQAGAAAMMQALMALRQWYIRGDMDWDKFLAILSSVIAVNAGAEFLALAREMGGALGDIRDECRSLLKPDMYPDREDWLEMKLARVAGMAARMAERARAARLLPDDSKH